MGATARKPLMMVAAMTKNRVIGKDGGIPWHHSEDSKHFRRVTQGHAVIMGRATYDSIGKPLPKRRNIVISRAASLQLPGCEVTSSLAAAIELAREHDDEPCVIGGADIYAAALPFATRLVLTYLDEEHEGDRYFPAIDPADWIEQERRRGDGLTFVTLVRR
ncbi:MAG: dihydrofolate reductase [Polyangiales bacterium]